MNGGNRVSRAKHDPLIRVTPDDGVNGACACPRENGGSAPRAASHGRREMQPQHDAGGCIGVETTAAGPEKNEKVGVFAAEAEMAVLRGDPPDVVAEGARLAQHAGAAAEEEEEAVGHLVVSPWRPRVPLCHVPGVTGVPREEH